MDTYTIQREGWWFCVQRTERTIEVAVQTINRIKGTEVEKWCLTQKLDTQPIMVGMFSPEWVTLATCSYGDEETAIYVAYQFAAHLEVGAYGTALQQWLTDPFKLKVGLRYRVQDSYEVYGALDLHKGQWILRKRDDHFSLQEKEVSMLLPQDSKMTYAALQERLGR